MIHPSAYRKFGLASALLLALSCVQARGGDLTAIASFNGINGTGPYGNVALDANGNLYGTTELGGTNNQGTVWELAKGSNTITAIGTFNGTNGASPAPGATLDPNGNLYGTTYFGGSNNQGTVWEIAKGSNTITTVGLFNTPFYTYPTPSYGNVAIDANGTIYGTTYTGGTNNQGTVWELAKGSGNVATIASFGGTNGANPYSSVTLDANGNLYGTTYYGGVVWEVAKGSNTITTLASFSGGGNGALPLSGVTMDANGNLFGTTSGYGADGFGTVWELAKGSSTITALASFTDATGNTPIGNVTLDANGDIFGTAEGGGPLGTGTVWELAKGSGTITTLSFFNIINHELPNGANPYGGVTMDSNGNLFGTAISGGSNGNGTVWEIASAVPEPSSIVTGLIGLALASGFVLLNRASARLGRFKSM